MCSPLEKEDQLRTNVVFLIFFLNYQKTSIMKKLIFICILLGFLNHTSYAQEADKVAFQVRMNNHVTSFLKKDIDMTKAKELYGHTCDVHHIVTEDEIMASALLRKKVK